MTWKQSDANSDVEVEGVTRKVTQRVADRREGGTTRRDMFGSLSRIVTSRHGSLDATVTERCRVAGSRYLSCWRDRSGSAVARFFPVRSHVFVYAASVLDCVWLCAICVGICAGANARKDDNGRGRWWTWRYSVKAAFHSRYGRTFQQATAATKPQFSFSNESRLCIKHHAVWHCWHGAISCWHVHIRSQQQHRR